jgi:amino acid permease
MAFTCNYMVGTGFLTLPHAMVNSGLVLGVGVLIFMAWLSVVSVWVCARLVPLVPLLFNCVVSPISSN